VICGWWVGVGRRDLALVFQSFHLTKAEITPSICHSDRLRRSNATEEEWRNPENLSFTMPIQGVLSRHLSIHISHLVSSIIQSRVGGTSGSSPPFQRREKEQQKSLSALPKARAQQSGAPESQGILNLSCRQVYRKKSATEAICYLLMLKKELRRYPE
jgi:hypothetical protein